MEIALFILSIGFSIFVVWRLSSAREIVVTSQVQDQAARELKDAIFAELEQLDYDFKAGKLDDGLYHSEREKLIAELAKSTGQ